jgi:ATP-binding cassette, subfamily B, bacterial
VAGGLLPALGAIGMRELLNGIVGDGLTDGRIGWLVFLIVGASAGGQILSQIGVLASGYLRQRLTVLSSEQLSESVIRHVGIESLEDPVFRDQLFMAEQAALAAPMVLASSLPQLLQSAIVIGSFASTLAVVWSPMLLLLAIVFVPSLYAQRAQARRYGTTSTVLAPVHRMTAAHRGLFTDLSAAKEMKLFGFGKLMLDRYKALLDSASRELVAVERRNAFLQCLMIGAGGCAFVVGLWFVARGVVRHDFSVGDVTLFASAVSATQGATGGVLLRVGEIARTFHLFRAYVDVTERRDHLIRGTGDVDLLERLEVDGVWFRYGQDARWVLRNVTIEINAGQRVGLVGLNGAGKTTLIKLLCRLYDPERGRILWNGTDIRELDPEKLRRRLSAVFQDHRIYDLTLRENIALGDVSRIDDLAAAVAAAEEVGLGPEIDRLPEGYEQLLSRSFLSESGAQGTGLSGGQAQRVALARARMRHADLLILDEPNAGLDANAEQRLVTTLARSSEAMLFVSHRLGAIRDCDRIVVMADGRVVEQGSHDELIAAGKEYATLFQEQAARFVGSKLGNPSVVAR